MRVTRQISAEDAVNRMIGAAGLAGRQDVLTLQWRGVTAQQGRDAETVLPVGWPPSADT